MAHPLDGCRAKLNRAAETIQSLGAEIEVFLSSGASEIAITRQHQPDGLEYAFIARGNPEVPLRFAVLVGEIVHHMRSSLDHVVHALIVRNGQTPTRTSQFPICVSAKAFKDARSRGQIRGLRSSAARLVEAVQPFTSQTPDDTVLSVVNQMDILDKHKLLVVVTAAVALGDSITIGADEEVAGTQARQGKSPNIVGFGDPTPRKLSPDGVQVFGIRLADPAPEFEAEATFIPQIAFEKCGRVRLAPVIQSLSGMLAGTRHTVESFMYEF